MKKSSDIPPGINPRLIRPAGWSPRLRYDNDKMPPEARNMYVLSHLSSFSGLGQIAEVNYWFYTKPEALHFLVLSAAWTPWTLAGTPVESVREVMPDVADESIRELCQSLLNQAASLEQLNLELGQALAAFLSVPYPTSPDGFQELRQRIDDYRKTNGPVWAQQADIQPLIARLLEVVTEMKSLGLQLHAKVEPRLMLSFSDVGDFGDQRAKDLVDEASGAGDPKQAMRLLKQALRYGQTGIQASKAFMDLAGLYSDEGDAKKAIDYYTRSIDAVKLPNPMALYWRGELYYEAQQFDSAYADFEKAVTWGLYSPEYEQAQQYLAELRARKSSG